MKNFIFIAIAVISLPAFAQTPVCINQQRLGLYQYDAPTWPAVARIEAKGGSHNLSYSYDSYNRLWTYRFTPLEEKDYTIHFTIKLLGAVLLDDIIASYSVYRSTLVLNSPVSTSSFDANATYLIHLDAGFSVSSSSTTFNTSIVTCNSARISTDEQQLAKEPEPLFSNEQTDVFNLFPNPFSENPLRLSVNKEMLPGKVSVISSDGKSIIERIVHSDIDLNLPDDLNSGVYIVSFTARTGKTSRQKLLIRK